MRKIKSLLIKVKHYEKEVALNLYNTQLRHIPETTNDCEQKSWKQHHTASHLQSTES